MSHKKSIVLFKLAVVQNNNMNKKNKMRIPPDTVVEEFLKELTESNYDGQAKEDQGKEDTLGGPGYYQRDYARREQLDQFGRGYTQ